MLVWDVWMPVDQRPCPFRVFFTQFFGLNGAKEVSIFLNIPSLRSSPAGQQWREKGKWPGKSHESLTI